MAEPDWESEGLLDGVEGNEREGRLSLLRDLHRDGVGLEELRAAVKEQRLMFLPIERALGEEPIYSAMQIAEHSGVGYELLTRQWQALGLRVNDPDAVLYSERDLEAARRIKLIVDSGVSDNDVVDMARVIGQATSRVAEASRLVSAQTFLEAGGTEYDFAQLARTAGPLASLMEEAIAHVYRLQLMDQLRHEVADRTGLTGGQRHVAIGFADIVGWTELSEEAEDFEIGTVADRLATMTTDLLRSPVRLVKMIGDAAMFMSLEEDPLLDLALDLVAAAEEDEDFPQLRAGIASGEALSRWGDWYGRPVNLASRVCSRARPGSVLVTGPVAEACEKGGYRFSAAGEKRLKGIGAVPLWRARRSDPV